MGYILRSRFARHLLHLDLIADYRGKSGVRGLAADRVKP
jgi:hypothetical protein